MPTTIEKRLTSPANDRFRLTVRHDYTSNNEQKRNDRIWWKAAVASTIVQRHHRCMNSIAFQPTAEDLLAANRLNFVATVKSKQVARSYALGGLVLGIVTAYVFSTWQLGSTAIGAAIGVTYWTILLSLILLSAYLRLPRQVKRVYNQQKSLHDITTVRWSDEAISFSSSRANSSFQWADFVRIIKGNEIIILRQSDAMMNFIPLRVLSAQQAEDIAAKG